ncbi:ubiquinol-cytochrome c reductase iron-sulfur subunit [Halalkalicoccus tibetensis]|uniref:Ubiquinol-cytochrome c reductase iron-sulfur subunit n=1 Tax=Halalkalicoccus tibetensis TaxID=175632 RepID=A0ABD5V628_9EURY
MSTEEDKYPVESDRRRFVKGVVGAAAIAGIGSTGAAAVNTATPPTGTGGGVIDFMGIERTGGPAPRGMPIIPVEIDDDGTISGRWPEVQEVEVEGQTEFIAEEELGGLTYSSQWYQYCGKQTSPALLPQAQQNNEFLSSPQSQYEWQGELGEDEALNLDHFDDYEEWGNEIGDDGVGKPAAATWRSDGLDGGDVLEVIVIRSTAIEEAAEEDEFLEAATEEGVFAFLNVCTHFCCIPGFKVSETADNIGAGDSVFCQCHQSVYDPFSIFEQSFISFPQPDDVEEPEGGGDDEEDGDGEEEEGGEDEEGGEEEGGGDEDGGGDEEEEGGEEGDDEVGEEGGGEGADEGDEEDAAQGGDDGAEGAEGAAGGGGEDDNGGESGL